MANSFVETAKRREGYRAAKLALLKIQALQKIERTDASARQVEQALSRVAAAMTDVVLIPAISNIAADLQTGVEN